MFQIESPTTGHPGASGDPDAFSEPAKPRRGRTAAAEVE